jgi:predicted metalloprotease with PDZ domain
MMKSLRWFLALVLLVGFAAAGFAGGDHKCDKSAQDCLDKMADYLKSKGWVGIETEKTADGRYAVSAVTEGSPADEAGFRPGDVLVALNGVEFAAQDKAALKKAKESFKPGNTVKYTVERAGERTQLAVTLAPLPDAVLARWIGEHMLDEHSHVRVASN